MVAAGRTDLSFFCLFFFFPGMGSSKLIARKPRNHLQTQTSAYTLVAYGERARAQTCKVAVYLHFQGRGLGGSLSKGLNKFRLGFGGWVAKGSWGRGRRWAWAGTVEPTWMLYGGHRRQHVSGTPESQLQGWVSQVDTGSGGGLWSVQMAPSVPMASLFSSHPSWSRDGREDGGDSGDTNFGPLSQSDWPTSGRG